MTQKRTIEDELSQQGNALTYTVGASMEPLLHERKSTVALKQKQGRLHKYDVVLYCRPSGEHILHRVVEVLDGGYRIRGDNCCWDEIVPEDWVVGVMTGYYPDEQNQYVDCSSRQYRNYLRTLPLRYACLCLKDLLRRIKRKVYRV